jgi:hypothetical protein
LTTSWVRESVSGMGADDTLRAVDALPLAVRRRPRKFGRIEV